MDDQRDRSDVSEVSGQAELQDVRQDRRCFLVGLAAAAIASTPPVLRAATNDIVKDGARHAIGVNAWTLRRQLATSPASTLERVVDIGFDRMSFYDIASTERAVRLAQGLGLRLVGLHFWSLFEADGSWEPWVASGSLANIPGFAPDFLAGAAKRHGFSHVVCSGDPPAVACSDRAAAERYCAVIGRVGRELRERGVRFLYHAHLAELQDLGDGRSLLDLLIEQTEPVDVGFEPDTFWLTHVGRDPVAMIRQLGRRAEIVYVRDRKRQAPPVKAPQPDLPEGSALYVPVGMGGVDLQGVIRAARDSGVMHLFLEDDAPGRPIASLSTSYKNLGHALDTL